MTNDQPKRGRATEAELQHLAALVDSVRKDQPEMAAYAEMLNALADQYEDAYLHALTYKLPLPHVALAEMLALPEVLP